MGEMSSVDDEDRGEKGSRGNEERRRGRNDSTFAHWGIVKKWR